MFQYMFRVPVICCRILFYPDIYIHIYKRERGFDSILYWLSSSYVQLTKVTCCTHDIAQSMIAHDYEARVRENDDGVAFQIRSMNARNVWRRLFHAPRDGIVNYTSV